MNRQYPPHQQQFGLPPQEMLGGHTSPLPPGPPPPQGFQNVNLGPQKPPQPYMYPPGQMPTNPRPVPPSQLPPEQEQKPEQFVPPMPKPGGGVQNGPQFQNGPPNSINKQLPPQQMPRPGPPPQPYTQPPPPSNDHQGPPAPRQYPTLPGQPPSVPIQPNPMLAQPPPPNHFNQPPPNRQFNQPPMSNLNQPPMPNLNHPPMSNLNQPPMPNLNQPPMPNLNQPPPMPGPNQLANQMQGMNLSGPAPGAYPPGPSMKRATNGDGGPHMPPPLTQQQYMNGQQMRGQQGFGQPPVGGAMGAYPQPAYQQPQQAKRLDPDQMPSPIQVTQDDQQNRSGIFCTNQKGLVPPLVTTNFIVQDQGNSSPRFIRSSMYNVPISQDIMKQTAVPFSLVISPMARTVDQEYPPPIVNFGELGPVRCIRCKAYMCPFMQFIDSGRRFQCLFCKATTDVPQEYFQHLDHTGQRLDRFERPELVLGTYEFVATPEYCRNNTLPKPPAIIFVIDVSYNNIKSGLVHLLCAQIKEIIQHLPVDQGQEKSNMRVGFITYNSSVHFYNIKGNLAAPQMLIVGDIQEMFMPLLDGFLCTPEESGPVIDALMQQIPAMFGDTRETETILLPAILAGLEALKASECAGKLCVFHSSLPTAEGPGKLKNRDDRKLLGTDKERTVLTPQTQAYNQLGQDCVAAGCSVDLFIFNNAYIDIATISQVSRLTGGEVHKYTYFQADIDGERLIKDIITNISRPIAFDAIMRVRTSTGVRPTDFYGHFYMSNTTDMELAAIDCDKAVAVEIKHDDKLSEEEGVYIQAALLYTSCSGQRRLRVMNLSLKTCSQMSDLYRNCDCDTIINYVSKQATYKLYEHNPKAVKDSIVTRAAQILASYRKNCASPSSAGQLILPECMKLLPLYVNCLLKSDALSGGSDMTIDDRSYVMQEVMIMDIPTSVNYFYPRLIPLIDLDVSQDPVQIPSPIRCTIDKMSEQGVYILENGIHMFLWIGLEANPDFIQKVFGVPSAIQVDVEKVALPELDNSLSVAVRNIIEEIRIQRHKCMRLTIVRQREKLEPVFKHFLAEDRGTDGSPSYVDFLIHMHKEIRSLLS
ncbi:protein transport protein Sec24C [Tribolium castaneum]|uniref:Protein transport protein Sec24C-like protein n=1 Tax=Tribolium castaneum TaxID=7070 RepID=D7EJY5_TRICA|nr:PREDICTED: protein transport protein Sec24C [Tribolium castaneum]KYB24587.1 Protein transport protein Sec24C-like protein [Tribolium castaneum]|eukprot:XP_971886.1 PREDICTED: protein transport protein Sec24C [Tribolium castaneum]